MPLSIHQQGRVSVSAETVAIALAFEASRRTKDQLFTQQSALVQTDYSCYHTVMSTIPLDIRRQAKDLIETGKTSAEVGALLDIKPGTIREWKRRYMWDGPEGLDRPCNDDLDNDQVPAEYERVMSLDVMDTLDWIRRMPMPRRIDAILKRERALELLSKRAERVIGGLGRQLGQQNKVIQVNAITQVLNSKLTPDSV